MMLQDVVAIAVATAAAAWLLRSLRRDVLSPRCGPGADLPGDADGFVPIDGLAPPPERRMPDRP